MNWDQEKKRWPHADKSRFINSNRTRWHIQQFIHEDAKAKHIFMLHGSGATTHSFADLAQKLSEDYSVHMIDLPGHGFTAYLNSDPTLDNVSTEIAKLLKNENISPDIIVGHSAGAAIAAHMSYKNLLNPNFLVSINGAFFPFEGFARQLFPAAAKLLFLNPFVPKLFAFSANENSVERLLSSTGSKLSTEQRYFYSRAMQNSRHVEGTLALMANWDLENMANELAALEIPILQIIGSNDGTISPAASQKVEKLIKHGERIVIPRTGHLVHEEQPERVCEEILRFIDSR